jgi:hypothetical protein
MRTFKELKEAVKNNLTMVWNDPDPIEGNDYTITYIENLDHIDNEEDYRGFPILIQYGEGSEAEVFLNEILIK